MKPSIIFFVCASLLIQIAAAQDSLPEKHIVFTAKIKTANAHVSLGYLYALTDSMLFLSQQKQPLRFYDADSKTANAFNYQDLEKVRIYKKGKVWRSTLEGFLAGAVIGAAIGFAGGDDSKDKLFAMTAGEKALGAGTFVGAVGTITGLIVGLTAHKTFIIHGRKESYEKMRNKMMARVSL